MSNKTKQMKFYDSRLVELNALINNTAVINRPSDTNNNQTTINDSIDDSFKNQLVSIKDIIVLDPYRAKIELVITKEIKIERAENIE